MPLNLPNLLTWLRIVLIPLFVGIFYLPDTWLSVHEQELAATVDLHRRRDHRLARRLPRAPAEPDVGVRRVPRPGGRQADRGRRALIVLLQLERVDAIVALIIIGREIAISALREWMAQIGQAKSVAVAFIGKLKTVAQMVAIPLLLYHDRCSA